MQKPNIMLVTTGRADYGILRPLAKAIITDGSFNLQFVATGSHFSALHGRTADFIKQDGLPLYAAVDVKISGDTESDVCRCISRGVEGFSKLFRRSKTDLAVVLGDRYELWPVCMAAVIYKIPIAHIHGGEETRGAIDNAIRHSITKMAAMHFASLDIYAKKIIQMGEDKKRVFSVGALGIDNIKSAALANRRFSGSALMTYHPVTLDNYSDARRQIKEILQALLKTELFTIITMPNADTAGNTIYKEIYSYVKAYPRKFKLIKNFGQLGYLNAMKHAALMLGNSSSGIIESASFALPVVNIGDRQEGRFKPRNVIDCACSQKAILSAIKKAVSPNFRRAIARMKNPYGDGKTAQRIVKILKSVNLKNKRALLRKG
ncbi:MAG: UDP-N-acetylglucosamine 2-epimerase [Elusimicrobia bacterium]|nr:UDP-N-acetylglucosamine 2-epimerase [Elusimicrobiota bacterium]